MGLAPSDKNYTVGAKHPGKTKLSIAGVSFGLLRPYKEKL
jgi:hypothetical protein